MFAVATYFSLFQNNATLLVFCFIYYGHRIHREGGMLLLLLLHFKAAKAGPPIPEHEIDSEYGYIEAYSGDQDGSDYMDYDDDYEYKKEEDLDNDFRSGGVDPEVNKNI